MEVLPKAGVILVFCALVIAWTGTFARWFPIKGLEGGVIKDYGLMIKAHIDYVLMSLFCFAIYATAKTMLITLPAEACWLIAIGGFTNPGVFVIACLKPDFWSHLWVKVYTGLSFVVTTTGFVWAGMTIFQAA